jgi:phosphotriesterase-related protein
MATVRINTVTGTITSDQLGRVLAHEHVMIGWPGWESDTIRPDRRATEAVAIGTDRIARDQRPRRHDDDRPVPERPRRDVELMAELAARTGLQIICATGLYKEDQGGRPYWKFRADFGAAVQSIAELYIRELTEASADGHQAGIIKVATGNGRDQRVRENAPRSAPPSRRTRPARRSRRTPSTARAATSNSSS